MIFKETKGLMDEKVGGHFYLGSIKPYPSGCDCGRDVILFKASNPQKPNMPRCQLYPSY